MPILYLFKVLLICSVIIIHEKNCSKDLSARLQGLALTGTQIALGFISKSPMGLILGQIIGYIASIIPLMSKIKLKLFIRKTSLANMKVQAKKYKDFPKYTMPATLANVLAINLTSILISALYNITQVGYYSLSNRIWALCYNSHFYAKCIL